MCNLAKANRSIQNLLPITESRTGKLAMVTQKIQATGLDARASTVKCPAWFVSHRYDILADLLLSGVPDFFDRNKILSGGDLSHYQVPHCIRVFFYFV